MAQDLKDTIVHEVKANGCQNIVNEGGCMTCRECGWSKCD